jgi:hypothetical protein
MYTDGMKQNDISKVMSELGKRSAKKLTKEQRSERAKKAINARWEKQRAKQA